MKQSLTENGKKDESHDRASDTMGKMFRAYHSIS